MDLMKAIRELYEEKKRIEEVIERLESLTRGRGAAGKLDAAAAAAANIGNPTARRRGRKSMSEEERAEVSRRMKEYWAKRRKGTKS